MSDLAQLGIARSGAGDRSASVRRDTPHPAKELNGGVGVDVGPVDVIFGGAGENHRQPDGIDAVRSQLLGQVHAIAQGLGHGPALVDHLALVEQPGERLGEVNHPHVVEDLGEEPRVQQMQDRVLDTAYVQVHGRPAPHRLHLERAVLVPG